MTKEREHEEKMHRAKTKVMTKHEQAREAHVEEKVESEPPETPKNKSREDVNQAAARIVREATED